MAESESTLEWVKLRRELDEMDENNNLSRNIDIIFRTPVAATGLVLSTIALFRSLSVMENTKKYYRTLWWRIGFEFVALAAFGYSAHKTIMKELKDMKYSMQHDEH